MSHNVIGSNCFQAQELDNNFVLKISGAGAVGNDGGGDTAWQAGRAALLLPLLRYHSVKDWLIISLW